MAKYVSFFSLAPDSLARFIQNPSDRRSVVAQLAESAGGSLESYYWMFGEYDGFGIFDLPDSATAAALSLAVTSSGAFRHFETHELVESGDLTAIAQRAQQLRSGYRAPGAS